jgi:hypothetical protein
VDGNVQGLRAPAKKSTKEEAWYAIKACDYHKGQARVMVIQQVAKATPKASTQGCKVLSGATADASKVHKKGVVEPSQDSNTS